MSASGLFSIMQRVLRSRGALVFALHRVLPVEELSDCYNPNLALTPESFDSFLHYLKPRVPVVSIEELMEYRSKQETTPVCVITFDDGWEDNHRVAYPII